MKLYILVLLIFVTLSCRSKFSEHTHDEQGVNLVNSIVLIFENPPKNKAFQIQQNGPYNPAKKYKLSYYNDNFIRQFITPKYGKQYDTIVVSTNRKHVEFVHNYQTFDNIHFYLQNGDTILIQYADNRPIGKLVNRACLPYDLCYDLMKLEHIVGDDFLALTKHQALPVFFSPSTSSKIKFIDQIRQFDKELLDRVKMELKMEDEFLDSIFNSKLMSIDPYKNYKQNIKYNYKLVEYDQGNNCQQFDKDISFKQFDTNHLGMKVFREALDRFIHNRFVKCVPVYEHSSGFLSDYRAVFDSIVYSDQMDSKAKAYALFECTHRIIENFSVADGKRYFSQFKNEVADSSLVKYIKSKYKLESTVINDIQLKDSDGKKFAFTELIKGNIGKVIYIDFWASWCAPCIKAIPSSKSLQNEYKDIIFVYLSIDDFFEKWQESSKKYKLKDTKHNYLIENRYTSAMLDSIALSSIPRYLIFNKNGILVHRNAPGPNNDEVKKLFDKYSSK